MCYLRIISHHAHSYFPWHLVFVTLNFCLVVELLAFHQCICALCPWGLLLQSASLCLHHCVTTRAKVWPRFSHSDFALLFQGCWEQTHSWLVSRVCNKDGWEMLSQGSLSAAPSATFSLEKVLWSSHPACPESAGKDWGERAPATCLPREQLRIVMVQEQGLSLLEFLEYSVTSRRVGEERREQVVVQILLTLCGFSWMFIHLLYVLRKMFRDFEWLLWIHFPS